MGHWRKVGEKDTLASIAHDERFSVYDFIWDAPENAELRAKRKNPNILEEGDRIWIPDPETREVDAQTETTVTAVIGAPEIVVRLKLLDAAGTPMAGAKGTMHLPGESKEVVADGEGMIEVDLDPRRVQTEMVLVMGQGMRRISVGWLYPLSSPIGQRQRLANLGYLLAPPDTADEADVEGAVEEFQADEGLPVNGRVDAATLPALQRVHGC